MKSIVSKKSLRLQSLVALLTIMAMTVAVVVIGLPPASSANEATWLPATQEILALEQSISGSALHEMDGNKGTDSRLPCFEISFVSVKTHNDNRDDRLGRLCESFLAVSSLFRRRADGESPCKSHVSSRLARQATLVGAKPSGTS